MFSSSDLVRGGEVELIKPLFNLQPSLQPLIADFEGSSAQWHRVRAAAGKTGSPCVCSSGSLSCCWQLITLTWIWLPPHSSESTSACSKKNQLRTEAAEAGLPREQPWLCQLVFIPMLLGIQGCRHEWWELGSEEARPSQRPLPGMVGEWYKETSSVWYQTLSTSYSESWSSFSLFCCAVELGQAKRITLCLTVMTVMHIQICTWCPVNSSLLCLSLSCLAWWSESRIWFHLALHCVSRMFSLYFANYCEPFAMLLGCHCPINDLVPFL